MSALPLDLAYDAAAETRQWVHVRPASRRSGASPQARTLGPRTPGGRPLGVSAPSVTRLVPASPSASRRGGMRLTRRGLAVVVGGFAALMTTALVVLVVGFLAVSNDPVVAHLPVG